MTSKVAARNGFWLAALIVPVATILLFGIIGGLTDINAWVSGIAVGFAEASVLIFIGSCIHQRRRKAASSSAPFTIAMGFIIGVYAVSVILEVILLGSLFKLSGPAYLKIHAMTLLGFAVVLVLVSLLGRYVAGHEEKEGELTARKRETVAWIGAIRGKLNQLSGEEIHSLDRDMAELEETLRYSDPIPHASLHEVENLIREKIAVLEDQVTLIGEVSAEARQGVTEETARMIRDILRTVQDRNMQLLHAKAGST